jgi:hypothetical protein
MRGMMTKIHDRRASDVIAAGEYSVIDVDDPYEAGTKITATRQLRGDPLARLHTHHQIDEAQYHAGRAYQRDWEVAERGAQAIDPTKEAVDGGRLPEPITDRQAKARKRLKEVRSYLGIRLHNVAHAVLIEGSSREQLAGAPSSQAVLKLHGTLFRTALDELAVFYDLAEAPKVCRA